MGTLPAVSDSKHAVVMETYPPGLFSWTDLVAHDLEAAKRFYAELFGWDARDQDTQGGPPYVMFFKDGHAVAGAGQMSDEMKAGGVPPMWNSYVSVEDAAATEAKARELGATITVPTMAIMDTGKMFFMTDPTGANIGVWQAGTHHGAGLVNAPDCLCWNEHVSRDVEGAKTFYAELFGWTYETSPMPGFEYTSAKTSAGRQNGGLMPMVGDHWQGIPPHWMVYFAVADIQASVAKLEALGGSVHVPITPAPGVGTFATVADAQGGTFTLMQLD